MRSTIILWYCMILYNMHHWTSHVMSEQYTIYCKCYRKNMCALFEIYHVCLTLIIYILSLLPLLLNIKINNLPLCVSPIVLAGRSWHVESFCPIIRCTRQQKQYYIQCIYIILSYNLYQTCISPQMCLIMVIP